MTSSRIVLTLVTRAGVIAGVIHPKNLTREVVQEILDGGIPQVEQAEAYPDPAGAEELFRMMLDREEENW